MMTGTQAYSRSCVITNKVWKHACNFLSWTGLLPNTICKWVWCIPGNLVKLFFAFNVLDQSFWSHQGCHGFLVLMIICFSQKRLWLMSMISQSSSSSHSISVTCPLLDKSRPWTKNSNIVLEIDVMAHWVLKISRITSSMGWRKCQWPTPSQC